MTEKQWGYCLGTSWFLFILVQTGILQNLCYQLLS